MEVILTTDIARLGNAGDVVRVKDGYGRNYLLPQGKAMLATKGRVAELEHKRRVIDELERKVISGHTQTGKRLAGTELRFEVQAGEEGKLFGSVTTMDIVRELAELGFPIERRRVELAEPIKQLGDYEIQVGLHREVKVPINVHVVSVVEETPAEEPTQEEAEAADEAGDSGDDADRDD